MARGLGETGDTCLDDSGATNGNIMPVPYVTSSFSSGQFKKKKSIKETGEVSINDMLYLTQYMQSIVDFYMYSV